MTNNKIARYVLGDQCPVDMSGPDGGSFRYPQLYIGLANPTKIEIACFEGQAIADLITIPSPHVFVVMWTFGRYSYETPFSAGIAPIEYAAALDAMPSGTENRLLVDAYMVCTRTNIIRAMRQFSLSPEFTARLHAEMRKQIKSTDNYTQQRKDVALRQLYNQYADHRMMIGKEVVQTKFGG